MNLLDNASPNALELPAETTAILEALHEFARKHVIERDERNGGILTNPRLVFDDHGRYSPEVMRHRREIRMLSAELGYYHMCVPEDLGGGGEGAVTWFAAWERLYRTLGSRFAPVMYDLIAHWASGPSHIFHHVTDALRARVFPTLMSGESMLCFAMSEPDAGSDIWNLKTRAVRDGDGWRISGVKQWISNGLYAEHALVFAITDSEQVANRAGGISAFLVSTDDPGFSAAPIEVTGHIGGHEGILTFENVWAPADSLVGVEGEGLKIGFEGLALGRLYNAADAIGTCRWALEQAREYALARKTFGKAIAEHQAIAFMLADCGTEILCSHLAALHAARIVDSENGGLLETSIAKLVASNMGCSVMDRVIQIHGGMGVSNELGFIEAWHHMRVARIADGSDEILRRIISRGVLRQDLAL